MSLGPRALTGRGGEARIRAPSREPGRGSVWLERCVRDAEVAGSNPVAPIYGRARGHLASGFFLFSPIELGIAVGHAVGHECRAARLSFGCERLLGLVEELPSRDRNSAAVQESEPVVEVVVAACAADDELLGRFEGSVPSGRLVADLLVDQHARDVL